MFSGILTLSYFLHNCVVIIIKNNEKKENNSRDLKLGYFAAGMSYLSIAIIGYFGFKGNGFPQSSISQNALDMFSATNPLAFVVRIILFTQMFTVYPIIIYFVRAQLFGYFYGTDNPSAKHIFIFSLIISSSTTLVTSVYPTVGTIVGIVGAFCGLYFVYVVPVCLYIYFTKPRNVEIFSSNQLNVAFTEQEMLESKKVLTLNEWRVKSGLHLLILLFGICTSLFQFYKA